MNLTERGNSTAISFKICITNRSRNRTLLSLFRGYLTRIRFISGYQKAAFTNQSYYQESESCFYKSELLSGIRVLLKHQSYYQESESCFHTSESSAGIRE